MLETRLRSTNSSGVDILIGNPVIGGTAGSVLFIDSNLFLAQNNAKFFWDNTNNKLAVGNNVVSNKATLAVGTADMDAALYATISSRENFTATSGAYAANVFEPVAAALSDSSMTLYGTESQVSSSGTSNYTGSFKNFYAGFYHGGSGLLSNYMGIELATPTLAGGGAITNIYQVLIRDATASNVTGILGQVSSGTNKYNLNLTGTAYNYLVGKAGFNTTSTDSQLNVNGNILIDVNNAGVRGKDASGNIGTIFFTGAGTPPTIVFRCPFPASGTSVGAGIIFEDKNFAQLGFIDTSLTATNGFWGLGNTAPKQMLDVTGFINWSGQARVSTQFDKTSDVTLANVTGLSVTVASGKIYYFVSTLYTTSNIAGGVQAAIGGTATAANIIYEGETTAGAAIGAQTRATALGTSVGGITAVTAARIDIVGTISVNSGGTLTVQFAQNSSNVAASSVLVGSTFIVQNVA